MQGGGAQFDGIGVAEQVAVEVGDLSGPEHAAASHLLEQVAYRLVEQLGAAEILPDGLGEAGKQPGALGVETKDDLVEITGQLFRVLTVLLHVGHDRLEEIGGLLGDGVNGAVGPELGRGEEGVAELVEVRGLVETAHRDFVPHRFHSREVGLYPYRAERGNDQQRRRLEVHLVTQQLA